MRRIHSERIIIAVSALAFSSCLWAADGKAARPNLIHPTDSAGVDARGPIGQPVLGFVAENSPVHLRAIVGVPGSASLSDPLPLPDDATLLRLAPDQTYALVQRSSADPVVLRLKTSGGAPIQLPGALQKPDFIAFSPKGRSVLLYSADTARLQVISGLPNSPSITWDIDTSSFLEQPVDAAISDDSTLALFTSTNAVYRLDRAGVAQQLLSVRQAAALSFLPETTQAAIGDRGAGTFYLLRSDSGPAVQIASGLTEIDKLAPAADGQSIWFTSPSGKAISSLNLKTAELRTIPLPISPSRLDGLRSRGMFLIATAPGAPTWMLYQPTDGDIQATFVPANMDQDVLEQLAGVVK